MKHALWTLPMLVAFLVSGCKERDTTLGGYERPIHRAVPSQYTLTFIFKQPKDGAYRDAFKRGATAAAADFGKANVSFVEPSAFSAEAQNRLLEKERLRATDLTIIESAHAIDITNTIRFLRTSELQVCTFEADCDDERSHRLFFISPVPTQTTGQLLADLAARQAPKGGAIAFLSPSTFDVQPKRMQKIIREELAARQAKYELLDSAFTDDDPARAKTAAVSLLANPNLKVIVVLSRHILPAVAAAVEEAQAQSRVSVIGLGTPQTARDYVKRGTVPYLVTWSPEEFGAFSTYLSRMIMNRQIASNNRFVLPRFGFIVMDDDELPMAEPMVITAETVDAYPW